MNSNGLLIGKHKLDRKVLFLIFMEFFLIIINSIVTKNGINFYVCELFRLHPFLFNIVVFFILLLNIPLYKINFQLSLVYNLFLLLLDDLLIRLFYNSTYDDGTSYTLTVMYLLSLIIGSFIMFIYCFIFNKKEKFKNVTFLTIGIICSCLIYYFINSSILIGNKY
jgi:hypothetical protein